MTAHLLTMSFVRCPCPLSINFRSAKSVYYIPKSVREFMLSDRDERLKIVTAGIKVLERMANKGKGAKADEDYRLVQDGIQAIVPHITTRKIRVACQDFCNLLGGGLVSLSTLHPDTLKALGGLQSGALICVYKYDPADVLPEFKKVAEPSSSASSSSEGAVEGEEVKVAAEGVSEEKGGKDEAEGEKIVEDDKG